VCGAFSFLRGTVFKNRLDAGEKLAKELIDIGTTFDILFGCVRGGVEVAYPLAHTFKKEIIPLFVHKIPSSINEEFAIGAVSLDGVYVLNEYGEKEDEGYLKEVVKKTVELLLERKESYGIDFDYKKIKDKSVVVVDDGIATGETLFAGVKSLSQYGPKEVYVAVPVSSYEGFERLSTVSKVISLYVDKYFLAVSEYYEEFSQLKDEEVKRYLQLSKEFSKI